MQFSQNPMCKWPRTQLFKKEELAAANFAHTINTLSKSGSFKGVGKARAKGRESWDLILGNIAWAADITSHSLPIGLATKEQDLPLLVCSRALAPCQLLLVTTEPP